MDSGVLSLLYADLPSRPNMSVNMLIALEILKAGFGWSDEEMYDNACYNHQVRYANGSIPPKLPAISAKWAVYNCW